MKRVLSAAGLPKEVLDKIWGLSEYKSWNLCVYLSLFFIEPVYCSRHESN